MRIILLFIFVFFITPSWAGCKSSGASQTEDDRTALIPFGKINLNDEYFFPVGSLLGSVAVPPTNYTYGGATASTVLWTCDRSDLPNVYFLVATNGDDRVGGYWDLGKDDGIPDVYATYFGYVGIKQTMGGVVLTRYWQRVPVTSYAVNSENDSRVDIRLQDIPVLQAELYRISSLPPGSGSGSAYCGRGTSGVVSGKATGVSYSCTQPNSYIQLAGPGLTHDNIGEDSNTNYRFWGVDNGFGYGMRTVNALYDTPTCVARNATPLVLLPTISVNDLNQGAISSAQFNITVECSDNSVSGNTPNSGQTAMGLQVSNGSFLAAKNMGLVNGSNGVSMLVSDNYTEAGMAKGVGITIAHSNAPDSNLTLIGQQGTDILNYSGSSAGWYPVLDNANMMGSSQGGHTNYTYNLTASLRKISGQVVTPGKVSATATIVVQIQ